MNGVFTVVSTFFVMSWRCVKNCDADIRTIMIAVTTRTSVSVAPSEATLSALSVNFAASGAPKDVRPLRASRQQRLVDDTDRRARRDAVEHVVQGEEERGLRQDGEGTRRRVGTRLLVQLHHLFGLALLVVLVALLDLLHLRAVASASPEST